MKKRFVITVSVLVLIGVVIWLIVYLSSQKKTIQSNDSITTVQTFQASGGWGYDVLMNDVLYVHQPTIPVVSGEKGFKTKEDAEKTAGLVITKIRNNILPPTLTLEELRELGVVD
jgi:CRISPR/Cas system type I-B associated protein Csh2 (Cas7 group RAMP superfamily)